MAETKTMKLLKAMAEWKKSETNPLSDLIVDTEQENVEKALSAVYTHFDDLNLETKIAVTLAINDLNDAFDRVVNMVSAIQEGFRFEVD